MAITWSTQQPIRLDDLSDDVIERESIELWEGEIVKKMSPGGWDHNRIAYRIAKLFDAFVASHPDLDFAGDNDGFILARNPDVFFAPDASLFRRRPAPAGPWRPFCPELAVEVVSPGDRRGEVATKRGLYLRHGAEQVWIVDPDARAVEVHFADGRVMRVERGALQGEGVAAGLTVDLDTIFAV